MASIVYVSSSTTDVITEIASTSEVIISNLQGPQGATGPQGPQGTPGGIASVVAPITNVGTETAAIIGINASSANTANYVVQRDANKEFVAGAVTIDTTLTPTSAPGKLYWDGGGTVNLGLAGGNVSVALGENLVSYVTNAEATTLAVGEVVYVFGASGDRPSVKRASNASEITSSKTLGIVAESIGANQIGFVITRGIIGGLALGSYTEGAPVYLGSTAGTFTSTKPVAPANLVALGWVIRANNGNGQIYVNVQNGFELEELHNVLITSAANGNFLVYDSATTLWKNQAISATAPVTYNAGTRTIAANSASTSASGVVQLSDSTSTTSSVLAATPTAVKAAYDLATTANATANAAIPATQKAAANGVATLDSSGLVPTNQLPALAITNTFVVNSQAAMLALTAQPGDVAIRTDLSESYILTADPASTLANWQELLSPPDAVTSVDGRVGAVTLTDKYAQLATANTFTGGVQQINTLNAATAGLVIKASASQTENLQVWQNSSASNLVGIGGTGGIFINRTTGSSTTALIMSTGATTSTGIRVDGVAGQTADLQAWRDSGGTVLSNVTASGGFETNGSLRFYTSSARSAWSTLTNTSGNLSFNYQFALTDRLTVTAGVAATVPVTVKGAASQSGDLTQWQDSTSTVKAKISASGFIFVPGLGDVAETGSFFQTNPSGTNSGAILFGTRSATNVGVIVKGAASQTGDLLQIQDSAGSVLTKIDSSGRIVSTTAGVFGGFPTGVTFLGVQTQFNVVGLVVRGGAGQTADTLQIQNSNGTVLDSFDNTGNQRSQTQLIQYGAEGSVLQNIPTRVHPAETLLKQAVWWIDSAHSGSSGQAIKNLGWGGAALDATAGSTTSADSNDPKYLEWSGINYVYLPGVVTNHLTTPDAAALDITGDIDLRAQVALDDWTPGAINMLISKWQTTTEESYLFYVLTDGRLEFNWSVNGTLANTPLTSSVATGIADGSVKWVRITVDVNNGASGKTAKFFTSDDGNTWTQLGTDVVQAGTTSIFSSSSQVAIGAYLNGTSLPLAGKVYRAQILNGIDGVPVLDVDTSVITSGAATNFTALTGQTVTIARGTSGRKIVAVTHPVWLFGTDDYMEVNNRWLERTTANYLYLPGVNGNYASSPDSAALDITGDIDLRVKLALDDWTPANQMYLVGKWAASGTSNSYALRIGGSASGFVPELLWSTNGSDAIVKGATVAPTITDGSIKWIRATLDVDNGASGNSVQFFTSDDGTTWTQLGTTVTTAGVTSIFSGTGLAEVGSIGAGAVGIARGKFFRAQVLNGIGGTVAFDANFETGITTNLPTTFTESSANAATVTINYSGTGYRSAGVIASTYVFPGATNTFKLSAYSMLDFGATDSFSVVAIVRQWATPATSFARYIGKNISGISNNYGLSPSGTSFQLYGAIRDNVTEVGGGLVTYTAGAVSVLAMQIDRTGQTITSSVNGAAGTATSISTVGTLSNPGTLKTGVTTGGASQDFEFIAAAIFRRALTAAEIATLNSYFQGRVA